MNETQTVATAKATSSRASDSPITKCFVCEQTLFLSFFFDALGHDRLKDRPKSRLSNAARVFEAHNDTDEPRGVYRFYYEGLGTDLRASPGMADAAQKALLETGKAVGSEAGGKAKEAVTDKAKAVASGVAQGQSLKLHTEALRKELPGDLRKALTDPSSYVEGVLQSIFSKVVDIFPQFRDNKLVASALNTGAQARIDKALKDFDGVLAAQAICKSYLAQYRVVPSPEGWRVHVGGGGGIAEAIIADAYDTHDPRSRAMGEGYAAVILRSQFLPQDSPLLGGPEALTGGFRQAVGNLNVQIDVVQHASSALLSWLAVMENEDAPGFLP